MLLGTCVRAARHILDPLATTCCKVALAYAAFRQIQFPLHLPLAQDRAGLEEPALVPSKRLSSARLVSEVSALCHLNLPQGSVINLSHSPTVQHYLSREL